MQPTCAFTSSAVGLCAGNSCADRGRSPTDTREFFLRPPEPGVRLPPLVALRKRRERLSSWKEKIQFKEWRTILMRLLSEAKVHFGSLRRAVDIGLLPYLVCILKIASKFKISFCAIFTKQWKSCVNLRLLHYLLYFILTDWLQLDRYGFIN